MRKLIAISTSIAFLIPSFAFASQVFVDNFDSYSTGNIAGNNGGSGAWTTAWTNYGAGTNNTVSTSQSYSSPNSQAVGSAGAYRDFTNDTSYDFYEEIYVPSSGAPTLAVYVGQDHGLTKYCDYHFQSGTGGITANGGATASLGSYTQDAWNLLHLQGDTTNGCRGSLNGGAFSSYANPSGGFSGIQSAVYICDSGSTCGFVDNIANTAPVTPSTGTAFFWSFWW